MSPDWEVHYSREAANYLADNGEFVSALFFTMECLADSPVMPPLAAFPLADGRFSISLEGHQVLFSIQYAKRIIFISAVSAPVS